MRIRLTLAAIITTLAAPGAADAASTASTAANAAKAAKASVLGVPAGRPCVRRTFSFRVRAPRRLAWVRVSAGRRTRVGRGRSLRRRVVVKLRGSRPRLTVVAMTRGGRRIVVRRRFRVCSDDVAERVRPRKVARRGTQGPGAGASAPASGATPAAPAAATTGTLRTGKADTTVIPGCAADPVTGHPGGEWPQFNQNLDNTRVQPAETTIGPAEARTLSPLWTVSLPDVKAAGTSAGTPIVARGCLFTGTNGGSILALNAETGKLVWQTKVADRVSTLAYSRGQIFANVGKLSNPHMVAVDAVTGAHRWTTQVDNQAPSELTGSPTPVGDMVMTGVSNWSFDQDPSEYYQPGAFRGAYALLDQETGRVVRKEYIIDDADFRRGVSGGGIWSTPAVDLAGGYAYVGTGNPSSDEEHKHTNALLKIDVDPQRATFGKIVGSYRGVADSYNPFIGDLDFGASPTLWTAQDGRKTVGALQKAGIYHAASRADMKGAWQQTLNIPTNGGNAGTAAVDSGTVYVPTGQQQQNPEILYALDASSGAVKWAVPAAGGSSYGPTTVANGVIYMADKAALRAFDAIDGTPVMARPLAADGATAYAFEGGVAVARNTVYANAATHVVAYRPGVRPPSPPAPAPPTAPDGSPGPGIVAGPGASSAGYLTPAVTVPKGSTVSFANTDFSAHDVVSKDRGGDGEPLFKSALVSQAQTVGVSGTQKLAPGSYGFLCSIHPSMQGTLTVVG